MDDMDRQPDGQERLLTTTQVQLLDALYTETTMTGVARAIGYSPRHCRRLVRDLLDTMEVATTRQAVADAVINKLIKPTDCLDR